MATPGLSTERHGSGPPLVLLHFSLSDRRAFDGIAERVADERELVTIELPGHGGSPPVPGPQTVPALTTAVAAELDAQGLAGAHLAGCSIGGWIALELAARGYGASVTAFAPSGFLNGTDRSWLRFFLVSQWLGARGLRRWADALARPDRARAVLGASGFGHPARVPAAWFAGLLRALAASPVMPAFAWESTAGGFTGGERIACPVTIAWGDRDRVLPARQALRAAAALPQARLVGLPGCGHVPFWDEPDLCARVLLEGSAGATPRAASPGASVPA